MSWFPQSKDHLPLTWWKRTPVYLAAVVAAVGLLSMVITAIAMSVDSQWAYHIAFSYEGFIHQLKLWTPLTYVFLNPPSIWVVIGTFLLWRFGEQVERFLGRRAFVNLLLVLLATPPLLILLMGLVGWQSWFAAGIEDLELGVFLAFVALYPRAQLSVIIATIPAWVMAAVIVGVRALQWLSIRNWGGLVVLAGIVLVAWAFVRYEQGQWSVGTLRNWLRRKKKRPSSTENSDLTVLPPYREDRGESRPSKRADASKVDAILEKISTQGMQSLTSEERRLLEAASEELKRKG